MLFELHLDHWWDNLKSEACLLDLVEGNQDHKSVGVALVEAVMVAALVRHLQGLVVVEAVMVATLVGLQLQVRKVFHCLLVLEPKLRQLQYLVKLHHFLCIMFPEKRRNVSLFHLFHVSTLNNPAIK
jgi:hypothetical protein